MSNQILLFLLLTTLIATAIARPADDVEKDAEKLKDKVPKDPKGEVKPEDMKKPGGPDASKNNMLTDGLQKIPIFGSFVSTGTKLAQPLLGGHFF
ncbi:hypothetical protein JYU34_009604 [Plutella xylostella]|uniref:Uncharacterized protein n=1 Tax=Plutella xylostella TaxID=51655 RepID=A0ABQ7QJX5_PLUXY|nr:hypothetical protein JYU34_009604 [Plutella xylostella]